MKGYYSGVEILSTQKFGNETYMYFKTFDDAEKHRKTFPKETHTTFPVFETKLPGKEEKQVYAFRSTYWGTN